jgi:hypothetical protein
VGFRAYPQTAATYYRTGKTGYSSGHEPVYFASDADDVERFTRMIEQSRMDRLSRVREELAKNTYRVSGREIARKLIEWNEEQSVGRLF